MFDLKGFRKKYGLKQSEVADMVDCKQSYISNVENGVNRMTEQMLSKLIAIYGMDVVQPFISDESDEGSNKSQSTQTQTYSLSTDALDIIKEQSRQIATAQAQIDRLIGLLEESNRINQELRDTISQLKK